MSLDGEAEEADMNAMPNPINPGWRAAMVFMAMWAPMMIIMMLPSFLTMFRRSLGTRELGRSAIGYFTVWVAAGFPMFLVERAIVESRSVAFWVSGALQLSRRKRRLLSHCRESQHCDSGLRHGMNCVVCCFPEILALLALGMGSFVAMVVATLVITGEHLLSEPIYLVRGAGALMVLGGFIALSNFGWR